MQIRLIYFTIFFSWSLKITEGIPHLIAPIWCQHFLPKLHSLRIIIILAYVCISRIIIINRCRLCTIEVVVVVIAPAVVLIVPRDRNRHDHTRARDEHTFVPSRSDGDIICVVVVCKRTRRSAYYVPYSQPRTTHNN